MNEIFVASEASHCYNMDVISVPARPLECVVSRTMHRASVNQMVKQIVQLFREKYTDT
jgi:hypothetical protein